MLSHKKQSKTKHKRVLLKQKKKIRDSFSIIIYQTYEKETILAILRKAEKGDGESFSIIMIENLVNGGTNLRRRNICLL